jgi:hypothetical protein
MDFVSREEFMQLRAAFDEYVAKHPSNVSASSPSPAPAQQVAKPKRAPSEYNLFIQSEMKRIRASNPDLKDNKVLFKMCTDNWKAKHPKTQ